MFYISFISAFVFSTYILNGEFCESVEIIFTSCTEDCLALADVNVSMALLSGIDPSSDARNHFQKSFLLFQCSALKTITQQVHGNTTHLKAQDFRSILSQ